VTAAEGQDIATLRPRPQLLGGDRDFRLMWSASAVSQLGTQVSELAIPLAAIIVLHAGPAEIGALAALGYLPAALFGLYAGAWADRLSRRRIMITADIARFAALATVPVTYLLGVLALGQLYAVAFCIGTLSVFFDTASPAYLPALVARAELARANGRLQISEQGAAGIRRRQAAAASEYNRRTTWRPSALAATMTRPVSPPRRPRVAGYHGRDVRACPARQRPGCDDRRSRAHRDQKGRC